MMGCTWKSRKALTNIELAKAGILAFYTVLVVRSHYESTIGRFNWINGAIPKIHR